jgi:hypothetical protein
MNLSEEGLGPARVVHVRELFIDLRATLVIDNVACGPAIGGLRMAIDVSPEECARLARAMTLKNAAAGLAHGGGKSVLYGDPQMARERKEQLIRAFAYALRNEQDYIFGPDMGTDEQWMAWVHDEIGRAVGLPPELGGIPLDQLGATGWGLCCDIWIPAARPDVCSGFHCQRGRRNLRGHGIPRCFTKRGLPKRLRPRCARILKPCSPRLPRTASRSVKRHTRSRCSGSRKRWSTAVSTFSE